MIKQKLSNHENHRIVTTEGAKVSTALDGMYLLDITRTNSINTPFWEKEIYQEHFRMPVINECNELGIMESDSMLWYSYICKNYRREWKRVINKESKQIEYFSEYRFSVEMLISELANDLNKEIKADKKKRFIDSLEKVLNKLNEFNSINIKSENKLIIMSVTSKFYRNINKFFYNRTLECNNKELRLLKSSISVFVAIMCSAWKEVEQKVFGKDVALNRININKLLGTEYEINDDLSNLDYNYFRSSVCFKSISKLSNMLKIDKKTISNTIRNLASKNIVSFLYIAEWGSNEGVYFITDSFSEIYLLDKFVCSFPSYKMFNLIEIKTLSGYFIDENISNTTPLKIEKTDFRNEKFSMSVKRVDKLWESLPLSSEYYSQKKSITI
ncbi:hypothetical protein [Vagococcus fluvialis]|uniref:hypothetical protein n=1 Tax=Vagococcus fluvialis TaxID=2738 RepID=UPI003794770F